MRKPPEITAEVIDHVAWITIDRPERRNALSLAVMDALADAFAYHASSPAVRALVVRGAGHEAFSAGADLKEAAALADAGLPYPQPMSGLRRNLFELVLETPKPTIAAINGTALGAGLELALACDIRLMVSDTVIGLPEAKRGMGANFGSVILPRLIPHAIAMDILYTGRNVGAAEALNVGLVNQVHGRETFDAAVTAYAATIATNAPLTLQRYKEMSLKGGSQPIQAALRLNVGPNPYTSEDRAEGARAFAERRAPVWRGR